jgi:hypothetical protein
MTTRFDDASFDEVLIAEGILAPGVFAGRLTTEVLWKLERVVGVEGTTKVDEAFFAAFLTVFLADFLTALFFTADFLTAFLADFFTALFFTAFLAEVFFAVFFAVFLTATVLLLGLRLKYRFKTQ